MKRVGTSFGFTLPELIFVFVVLAVFTGIITVSYSQLRRDVAMSSLQTHVAMASRMLERYRLNHGTYPASIDATGCPTPADAQYCIKYPATATYEYHTSDPWLTYTFRMNRDGTTYQVTDSTGPTRN